MTESADVPTFFLKVVGIDSISETVLVTEDGPHVMSRAPFDEKLML